MPTYPLKKLSEICYIINGSTPSRTNKEYWENGTVAWFTIEDVRLQGRRINETRQKITEKALKETSVKLLPVNTILLCCTASIGEYAITKIPVTTNQQFNGLVIKDPSEVNPDYLFHFCATLKDALMKVSGKTTIDFIPISRLKELHIPLPPLSVQEEIVAKLDAALASIDEAKTKTEQALAATRELWESTLEQAFRGGDGWTKKKLGEIGNPKMCKRIFKEQTKVSGDIPFYKIGTFGKEPDAFISKEIYNEFRKKFFFPKKGDILISASGTIGRRVKYDGSPAYFQDSNIVWIDNDEKEISNDFLFEFYGACKWESTKGATISRLYNDNLKSLSISFPSLPEQSRIVAHLDAVRAETDRLASLYGQKLADLDELRRSVLQEAFA